MRAHSDWLSLRVLLPALLLLAWSAPAAPAEEMRNTLAKLARQIQKYLEGRKETRVALGAILADKDALKDCNSGPGLCQMLREELNELKIEVVARARYRLAGNYRPAKDRDSGRVIVQLQIRLEEERNGETVYEFDAKGFIDSIEGVQLVLGGTADTWGRDGKADPEAVSDTSAVKPSVHAAGSRVAASATSPYALEVLVKQGGKYSPRPVRNVEGEAHVTLARDDVFAVKLHNDSDQETAVRLFLDGIDVFSFLEGHEGKRTPLRTVLVPPRQAVPVRGWPITATRSEEFKVTEYAKSAAARLQSEGPTGVLQAQFAASWPKSGKAPADELERRTARRSARPDAIGFGDPFSETLKVEERVFGETRAVVSVRYSK